MGWDGKPPEAARGESSIIMRSPPFKLKTADENSLCKGRATGRAAVGSSQILTFGEGDSSGEGSASLHWDSIDSIGGESSMARGSGSYSGNASSTLAPMKLSNQFSS